mgnify:CR=1 FL=1
MIVPASALSMGAMTLHLIKLCVGPQSLDELAASVERRAAIEAAATGERIVRATTRMAPKRADELLAGGSLFWVIRGAVQCRQRLLDIRTGDGRGGEKRCDLVLEPVVIPTRTRPCRPFQGWRYLSADEAPADLSVRDRPTEVPPEMARELMELCLL